LAMQPQLMLNALTEVTKYTPQLQKDTWHQGKIFRMPSTSCTYTKIINRSLKYNSRDATFSRSIYFYKLRYIFQAVSPRIIRSTKLYIQRQVLSNKYCCLLLSWNYISSTLTALLVWQYLTLYIQFCAPDDGRRDRPKNM
jgi:hypothetical protein